MMRRMILALTLIAGLAPAQQATIATFGSGCAVNGVPVGLGTTGLPTLGGTVTMHYRGPNVGPGSGTRIEQPFLVLGLRQHNIPLPQSLLPQQPAGCTSYVPLELILDTPLISGHPPFTSFATSVDVRIPPQQALLGTVFYAQWYVTVFGCRFLFCTGYEYLAVGSSEAAQLTIGR